MRPSLHAIPALVLLMAVGIEALSAAEWALYPYFPDRSLLFARIDAEVFSALAPLSPLFVILLLYTWPVRFAISLNNPYSRSLRSLFAWLTRPLSKLRARSNDGSAKTILLSRHPRLMLLFAIATAALLGIIPYRPDLNPSMTPVGVDAHFYIDSINQMIQRTPGDAISYVLGNTWAASRPLLLIPMYLAVAAGFLSPDQSVQALPLILGPFMAASTFFFVREASHNETLAGVASLFSTLSFYTTVGMWAGFYANWLALALAYLFLGTLFRFLASATVSRYIPMAWLSISVLLTHPWTWILVLVVAVVFMLSVWRENPRVKILWPLLGLVTLNIALDLSKSLLFGGQVAALDASQSFAGSGISLGFWSNLTSALFTDYEGLLANAVLLGLSFMAVLILRFKNNLERILMLWTVLGSLPFLVLPSAIQTRILYDLPTPILTSAALFYAARFFGNRHGYSNTTILLILLLSGNYALRAITSLVAAAF